MNFINFYQPRLGNNELASLPIHLFGYKLNFFWPLHKDATHLQHNFCKLVHIWSLLCYIASLGAEIAFIIVHLREMATVVQSMIFLFLGFQYLIKIFLLSFKQTEMRECLEYFYKEIYYTSSENRALFAKISKLMRIIGTITVFHAIPSILRTASIVVRLIIYGLSAPEKPFVFPFVFPYDVQKPLAYILTSIFTFWVPISFVPLRVSEDYLLCLMLIHTSYRYKALQQELENMFDATILEYGRTEGNLKNIYLIFRKHLYGVIHKQQRLDNFVNMAKSFMSYHIFYTIAFGVLLLCVVIFRLQMIAYEVDTVRFASFCFSQGLQILMLGYFGQILLDETSTMHSSYYMCKWELLLAHGNARSNIALMNDVKLAIGGSERGSVFVGMKMFPLTHETALSALRKAVSFFMFLKTVNEEVL